MFGLFKKKPPESPQRKWDDPGVEAAEGLPLLMSSLHLSHESRDVARNLPKKLAMLRMIVERSDSDFELPRRLLTSPRRDADGELDLSQLEEYDALTPYGQAIAMLLFALGNFAMFYGPDSSNVVLPAVYTDAVEARSLIYLCRAYERFGADYLVAKPIEDSLQVFRPKIDGFQTRGYPHASEQLVERKIVEIVRHLEDVFVRQYRPARMPEMSTREPETVPPLDLSELEAFAMASLR